MTDHNVNIDTDELPENQPHLFVNEMPIDGDVLTEGERYAVTVDIKEVQHHGGGFNLMFSDGNGDRRSVSFLEWETDIASEGFEEGTRVTVTHIRYEFNDGYHNLQVTSQSEVVSNEPLGDERAADDERGGNSSIDEFDEEAAIDDALSKTDRAAPENDTGHAKTTYRSVGKIDSLEVHQYVIQVEPGTNPTGSDRRGLAYDVVQHVTHHTGIPTTKSGDLRVVAVNPLDSVGVGSVDDVAGLKSEGQTRLDPESSSDRRQLKRLLEEAFKNKARDEGYRAHGMNKILSSRPIDMGVSNDDFHLYDRWDCTIDIGPSGRIYLHVEAKTRVVSDLTLGRISDAQLYPGRRIQTTYGQRRGYYFGGFTDEGAADHEITPGQTVVDYHRANEQVKDSLVDKIEEANRPAVKAFSMGGGDGPYTFPQELLVPQGNTKNLTDFAPKFANAARNEWHRSPEQRVEGAHSFASSIAEFSIDGQTVDLDTSSKMFTGDERFEFTELYEPEEDILTFADGQRGSHPRKTSNLKAYSSPDSFRVVFVYPENFEGDRADGIWQKIAHEADNLGAAPTRSLDIAYEPKEGDSGTSQTASRVAAEVGADVDVDAALCVLPPEDSGFNWAIPYDDLKEVLGDQHIDSQMVHADTLQQRFTHTNLALGLIAAAGGVPFTIENSLPGDADLIIGLDIGQSFDDAEETAGIRVGASTTAIYRDGTILGHTNTGAQNGERIPARELMRIVRQVVIGYRQRFDEPPEHIVIHRDGFMNDPIGEVKEYLCEEGISYDIVEVRKQAPMRIVNGADYGYSTPSKGVASIDRAFERAYLLTFGDPEDLAGRGTPRPITVERADGSTDIETLTRQVYLLSQCHIGVSNTTVRIPISTSYADRAAEAAANGHLPKTNSLETGIGFI